jgi:hypothetical protein
MFLATVCLESSTGMNLRVENPVVQWKIPINLQNISPQALKSLCVPMLQRKNRVHADVSCQCVSDAKSSLNTL